MGLIPKSHPRAESLLIRKRLVDGFDCGLVAKEGLLAQGRGEAFDYLLGERTGRNARRAVRAAAAQLLLADMPVISVNGNVAALCPREIVRLSKKSGARLEISLFYADQKRKAAIARTLRKNGAKEIMGTGSPSARLAGIGSARKTVDREGIFAGDVIVVPLEDGDRTAALRRSGKTVIVFDLNPLSRTSQTASIAIVDNIVRAIVLLIAELERLAGKSRAFLCRIADGFDNRKNLAGNIIQIRNNLTRRAGIA